MNTSVLDRAITDPEFEPVFAELARRGAIVDMHPADNGACSPLVSEHRITWMVGAPFEDTIAAMQLITSGHLQRYPAVKIICSHLGGPRPVIPLRADDDVAWETTDIPQPPSQAAHRLWDYTVSHCPRSGSAMRHRHIRPGGGLHRRDGRSQRGARHTGANAMALFGIRA